MLVSHKWVCNVPLIVKAAQSRDTNMELCGATDIGSSEENRVYNQLRQTKQELVGPYALSLHVLQRGSEFSELVRAFFSDFTNRSCLATAGC
eukprot:m.75403 g.75403  ORF g.75403 m.75403 type:complete len:92 (+) comp14405_c0_seq3:53-328(+)